MELRAGRLSALPGGVLEPSKETKETSKGPLDCSQDFFNRSSPKLTAECAAFRALFHAPLWQISFMAETVIEIRPANAADIGTIVDFNMALCRETEGRDLDHATVTEGVRRFVSEPARGRYFVAVIGGEVVGQTAHTFEWSDWRNGEIWWIQSVYVHPNHRGTGVFRALFAHIRGLGEEDAECCGIRLYMEHGNDTARQSYLSLGFCEAG